MQKLWIALVLVTTGVAISGCVPLAVGAGAVVVADEIAEDDRGGDGLL